MSALTVEAGELRRWLFGVALPLWWTAGADHKLGGFHEALHLDGNPAPSPHRARTIARQVFVYGEAGRLGWDGPWREATKHALDYLRSKFIRPDGSMASVVDVDGQIRDATFDLYDQAFGLLALAVGYREFGDRSDCRRDALALRAALETLSHPQGGYFEDRDHRLPQRANPHMHLLESALAWIAIDDDPGWRHMADGLAHLCLDKLIDPTTGALREFFADDWSPAPGIDGRVVEPGHHYEWAFLLARWAAITGRPRPNAVGRLIAFADSYGLDAKRGVAINAVLTDGSVHDPVARLWAQAERIRAYVIDRSAEDDARIVAAIRGLRRFLTTPTPGLWFDQLGADDRFIDEPARATSLYHIIGAAIELSAITDSASGSMAQRSPPRRIVYLVTEDWYFISHRLPMARAARDAGFEVHVATRVDRHGEAIASEGFHLHPLTWRRGSFDPRDVVRIVREVRALYRRLEPNLAHHVAVQAAVIGSIATTGLPIVCVNAITGLGTIFLGRSFKARTARPALLLLLRRLLDRPRSTVLVQNPDDRGEVERLGVSPGRIALIPGSGVDIARMTPFPAPAEPVTVAFAGRLVADKGIGTLIDAHRLLQQRDRTIRLLIAGTPDPANPTSVSAREIEAWTHIPGVTYLGHVRDMPGFWAMAHIAVLPSRREGLPMTLLEAAACGRPLVATNVPGCREVARPDLNALLVSPDDPQALADAIERLAGDAGLRARFGKASRELVEREFSSVRIGRDVVDLYNRLLQSRPARPSVETK